MTGASLQWRVSREVHVRGGGGGTNSLASAQLYMYVYGSVSEKMKSGYIYIKL